jgi:predicted cupin superfamily sugar epimerase
MRPQLSDLMKILNLKPLEPEGGFFVETYRTAEQIDACQFGLGHGGRRSLSTAIYYLLTPESFSAIHKVPGDEIFHFYAGDPVEMLELFPGGTAGVTTLGPAIRAGMKFQHIVKGGVWQGARLVAGGEYALLGTTMAPGFDYADFSKGNPGELVARYPSHERLIRELLGS